MSKTEWKKYKLGEIYEVHNGLSKGREFFGSGYPFISFSTVFNKWFIPEIITDFAQTTESEQECYSIKAGDILVTRTSETADELGMSCVALRDIPNATYNGFCKRMRQYNKDVDVDSKYVGYYMRNPEFRKNFQAFAGSMSTRASLTNDALLGLTIKLPPLAEQQRIAKILSSLDNKIELNNAINRNLEEQAQAIFKSWFIDFEPFGGEIPVDWKTIQAQEYFSISIGKTPPRKEQELFSDVNTDDNVKWVSISDMGSCGMYISDSSEYLTKEAITNYNVCIIPDNTVILSFKLTVGRIAITDGEMTSNEAIAHFCSEDKTINEYLYCYLKNFSFETMGSTSSIATAVNSKIIKAMPFILPNKETVDRFHKITKPLFDTIKSNQQETKKLKSIRDGLLPKLMSGDLGV